MGSEQQLVLATDASTADQEGDILLITDVYTLFDDERIKSGKRKSSTMQGPTITEVEDRKKQLQDKLEVKNHCKNCGNGDVIMQNSRPKTLEDIFADLKSVIENEAKSKNEAIRQLSEKVSELQNAYNLSEQSNKKTQSELTAEKQKLTDSQAARQRLSVENESLQSTVAVLHEQLQWKEDVVGELARKVERLDEEVAKLQVKEGSLRLQLRKYKMALRAKARKICGLRGAVEMAQKALRDYEATENIDGGLAEDANDDDVLVLEEIPLERKQSDQECSPQEEISLQLDDDSCEGSQGTDIESSTNFTAPCSNIDARSQHTTGTIDDHASTSKAAKPTRLYRCKGCGKKYCDRKSLHYHQRQDCDKPSVQCERCREWLTPRSLRVHNRPGKCIAKENMKSKHCPTYVAISEEGIKLYEESCKRDNLNHEECMSPESTTNKSEVMSIYHDDSIYDDLDEMLETAAVRSDVADASNCATPNIFKRKRSKSISTSQKFRCKCGKKYTQKSNLNAHVRHDCGKPPLQCEKCSQWYTPRSFKYHKGRDNCAARDGLLCKYCYTYVAKDGRGLKIHESRCKKNNATQTTQTIPG